MQNDVKQVDRDAAGDIWAWYVARTGEVMAEKAIRSGAIDEGLPTVLAAHRIAAEAAKDAEIAALQARVAELEGALGSAYYTLTYLEALTEDPLTKEAIKETRDEIDAVTPKEPTQ